MILSPEFTNRICVGRAGKMAMLGPSVSLWRRFVGRMATRADGNHVMLMPRQCSLLGLSESLYSNDHLVARRLAGCYRRFST